eukprot:scaffold57533_cov51-Phaeocystis_antarctica.AAC.3
MESQGGTEGGRLEQGGTTARGSRRRSDMALQEVLGGRRQEVGGVVVGGSRQAVVRAREVVLPWVCGAQR